METWGSGRYFLALIDDSTRKNWVYILKSKAKTFEPLKYWCIEIETKKELKVKCLRFDNGTEFTSAQFSSLCKEKGIKRHFIVFGNPQQNGLVERFNRTIMKKVRCMLLSSGFSKRFGEKLYIQLAT